MYDYEPRWTKGLRAFQAKERGRVVDISVEPDGVFIYTHSAEWCDDAGSGTFRGDSATTAIKRFYDNVQRNTDGRE